MILEKRNIEAERGEKEADVLGTSGSKNYKAVFPEFYFSLMYPGLVC